MKKNWKKLSTIGIEQEMLDYQQKSIILLNRISILFIILFSLFAILTFKKIENPIIGFLFITNIFVIIITIVLTKFKRANLSKFIISIFIPISILFVGAYAKSIGITNNIVLYIAPRILLTISVIIPILLFGFRELKNTIIAIIPGLILFILFYGYFSS